MPSDRRKWRAHRGGRHRQGRPSALPLAVLSVMAGIFIALGAAGFTATSPEPTSPMAPPAFWAGSCSRSGLSWLWWRGPNSLPATPSSFSPGWTANYALRLAAELGLFLYWKSLRCNADCRADVAERTARGPAGELARKIALAKVSIAMPEALMRGILCNMMVCLAVWLTFAARSVADKILAVLLPDRGLCAARLRALDCQHVSDRSRIRRRRRDHPRGLSPQSCSGDAWQYHWRCGRCRPHLPAGLRPDEGKSSVFARRRFVRRDTFFAIARTAGTGRRSAAAASAQHRCLGHRLASGA